MARITSLRWCGLRPVCHHRSSCRQSSTTTRSNVHHHAHVVLFDQHDGDGAELTSFASAAKRHVSCAITFDVRAPPSARGSSTCGSMASAARPAASAADYAVERQLATGSCERPGFRGSMMRSTY